MTTGHTSLIAESSRMPYVHEWFRAAARQYPTAPAIDAAGAITTFAALAARTSAVAQRLAQLGAVPGDVVAINLRDPADVIAASIGTLEAGCAFLALPAAIPDGRLDIMIAEVLPRWVIVDRDGASRVATCTARTGSTMTAISWEDIPASASYEGEPASPDALAYIVFTSGSTGRPKGIAGRLKGIDHFVRWEIGRFGIQRGVRVALISSPAFDVFLRDVFVPLCAGGTICIPPNGTTILDGRSFVDWLEAQDINLMHCVPSVFRLLLDHVTSPRQLASLQHVFLAGEPVLPSDVMKWTSIVGDRVTLVNLYGPSETTMTKFYHVITAADAQRASIPIGQPMPGAAALLIDDSGTPCSPGDVGEICIRTAFRSLGYYRQPALTAQAFVTNPVSHDADDLVYRTGDLGRLQSDGSFQFIGRRDQQVKIRGVRIELAEVESVIRESNVVTDAAVIDSNDAHGSKYLTAYLVLSDGASVEHVRSHLSDRLPDYMLPSRYVAVPSLPRHANGKLDRGGLPQPAEAVAPVRDATPRTAVHEIVAGIWSEVLQTPQVGLHDNFFEIGGHSLLATRVVSRLRRAFGIELPLRALFREPTVAGISRVIERTRLEHGRTQRLSIQRATRREPLPLSNGQKRLWFLAQLEPNSAASHVSCSWRLVGAIEPEVVRRALQGVVGRHEILRTSFPEVDGEPVQRVHPGGTLQLIDVDLTNLAPSLRSEAAKAVAAEVMRQPFNLSTGPLLRASLQRMAGDEHVVTVTMHHAVSDGWSIGILEREFTALFAAIREGKAPPLPEMAIQYGDYAEWEREWLRGERLDAQLAYWRTHLEGFTHLALPTDMPRSSSASHPAGRVHFALPPELAQGITALTRREGVTLFMLLLTAFNVVLSRWSGQRDIVVGTDVANREHLEAEELIGFFVNQVVLRTNLGGDPTFVTLIERVREVTLDAYAHQELPFQMLVEELEPSRTVGRHPIFQTVFAMLNERGEQLAINGVEFHTFAIDPVAINTDLTLVMGEQDGTITGTLLYARDLFTEDTAVRFTTHLTKVCDLAVSNPNARISELSLDESTNEAVRVKPHDEVATDAAEHGSICRVIEEYAARTPTALAAEHGDRQLSYAELDRRANQLAHYLRSLGVTSESIVATCVRRDFDLLISFVAILKAGASYLPLNPDDPPARIRHVLRGSAAVVLITSPSIGDAIAGDVPWISLEGARSDIEANPVTAPPRTDHFRALAYVIFTSGSTGVPKGVMLEHRGLWNHLRAKVDALRLGPGDLVAQNASCSFDISIWQMLAPLMVGGTVRIIDDRVATDGAALIAEVDRCGVTILEIVPALLEAVLDAAAGAHQLPGLRRLRVLLSTGEALSAALCQRWQQQFPHVAVINAYGPTECSDDVTHHHAGSVLTDGFVPIGRPLPGAVLHVVDELGSPTRPGVPGELHVGGVCVGRGYLGAPRLTAERFVPDARGAAGARVFKTGDLMRWNTHGELEFLGRMDEQIKIRGFRIELGEVQTALAAYPGVRQCTVRKRSSPSGDRLVGYIVPWRCSIARAGNGYMLPTGDALSEQNRNETEYLYDRIFTRQIYFQHGIELAPDACVFDVGANIGLFTSYVAELVPDGSVYSFEPIGPVFDNLRLNTRGCRAEVNLFESGLADTNREATFTYYPGYSIMSGLAKYANADTEVRILKQYLRNDSDRGDAQAAAALAEADVLLAGRLIGQEYKARLRRLSDVIDEERVDRIDLLKIDVQRAGLDVLRGISAAHWPRIDQVVMEVHDNVSSGGHVGEIEALLSAQGYDVIVEQEPLLHETDLFNLFARRPTRVRQPDARPAARTLDEPVVIKGMREALAERLPDYMVPTAFVLLPELPLTSNGKIDRAALPEPPIAERKVFRGPRDEVEELLCDLWKDVLEIDSVSIEDDFFELGGHSLVATRVASRVRQLLGVDLPVRTFFEARTVELLARAIVMREASPARTVTVARAIKRATQLSADDRDALLTRLKTTSDAIN